MLIQAVSGICERRIVINWKLPKPFRPRLVNGKAIVGVELLQLVGMRPTGMPRITGFSTKNAVDRIAVEWEEGGSTMQGFFVPTRYSPSAVNTVISFARLFPAVFKHADFKFEKAGGHYRIDVRAEGNRLSFEGTESNKFYPDSVFDSLIEAAEFHRDAKISYSPAHESNTFDGIYLKSFDWHACALELKNLKYGLIEKLYPKAVFDSAFVVRNTKHEWHNVGAIRSAPKGRSKASASVSAPVENAATEKKPVNASDTKSKTGQGKKPPAKKKTSAK